MTVVIVLFLLAAFTCMFVLADDIADMREELSLLNKRSDDLPHGDIPTMPTGFQHRDGVEL